MLYRCANSPVDNAVCKSIVMPDIIDSSGGICRNLSARSSCRLITARVYQNFVSRSSLKDTMHSLWVFPVGCYALESGRCLGYVMENSPVHCNVCAYIYFGFNTKWLEKLHKRHEGAVDAFMRIRHDINVKHQETGTQQIYWLDRKSIIFNITLLAWVGYITFRLDHGLKETFLNYQCELLTRLVMENAGECIVDLYLLSSVGDCCMLS